MGTAWLWAVVSKGWAVESERLERGGDPLGTPLDAQGTLQDWGGWAIEQKRRAAWESGGVQAMLSAQVHMPAQPMPAEGPA